MTTELEAVNQILSTIGERPVSSLTGDKTEDVSLAISTLREVTRDKQSRGFHWNTEYEYTLALDEDGKVKIPSNTIRFERWPWYANDADPVQRGAYLYDRKNQTTTFTEGVKLKYLVRALNFDEAPETFRRYVTIRSARIFADRWVGSTTTHVYTADDERSALADLMRDENRARGTNVNRSEGVYQIVARRPR